MIGRIVALLLILTAAVSAAETWTWWVEPCTPSVAQSTGCHASDAELAKWAFEAWQRDSEGALAFSASPNQEHARIRIHWASGTSGLYGETQPVMVDGRHGADIYVLPDVRTLGDRISEATAYDPLLRDAIVYLTCVHETGHALGLAHTATFSDIMYSFQFGGDIVEYFERYRRLLATRADIRAHSGTSDSDRQRLKEATGR